jgi:3-dehydroquinate synthase
MVDAAVGGKTGCDFESYKNMIGAFFPAAVLHVFPQFVQSLDETQYRSGLAEAFKTALLYSAGSFSDFELKHEQIKTRDKATLDNIIRTCVKAKAKIVGQDFTERNIRMQLNFGHTFGHALETISGLGIVPHGDAVAWGIARALSLSANKGLCSAGYCNRVAAVMQKYGWETGPVHHTLKNSNAAADLLQAMKKDKKNTGRLIRVILQKGLCTTVIQEVPDDEILSVLR